jgi:protocatechuate 3,4-dioxygenase beta subunit
MARSLRFLLLCALFHAIVIAQLIAQPSGQGVISGTVIDSTSGEPVKRAVVTATWQGTPRSWATVRTDSSGRFVFEGLPPGKYDLRANKAGLGTAVYGANNLRELGDMIALGAGEARTDLKLRFLRSAVISGRVLDRDGDPVPDVQVELLRSGRNLGERILVNYRGTSTNDRGEYKMPSIDPGEYYVVCRPQTQGQTVALTHEILVQQFFPGARDAKDAKAISVRGGEVLSGFDFRLMPERAAKITGRVVGVPTPDPPLNPPDGLDPPTNTAVIARRVRGMRMNPGQFVNVQITSADSNQQLGSQGTGAQAPDYHFELPDMATGRYRVQATVQGKEKALYASQIIDAGPGDTEVILTMVPTVNVKGHLKVEGPGTYPVENFTIALAPPPNSGARMGSQSARVTKDGSFTIENVPPGEWMLNINPSPGGPNLGNPGGGALFDKSVRLGDKDYLFKRLDIPAGLDAPLNIVVSSNTSTVEGEVDAGGADAKRAGIVLGAVGSLHNLARFYYGVAADDAGKFKINGVAPGKYKIFALEKLAAASFRNPESIELLDALGEELEVAEGAHVQAHPKLIPQEKAKEILKP